MCTVNKEEKFIKAADGVLCLLWFADFCQASLNIKMFETFFWTLIYYLFFPALGNLPTV